MKGIKMKKVITFIFALILFFTTSFSHMTFVVRAEEEDEQIETTQEETLVVEDEQAEEIELTEENDIEGEFDNIDISVSLPFFDELAENNLEEDVLEEELPWQRHRLCQGRQWFYDNKLYRPSERWCQTEI